MPGDAARERVHRIIYDELCLGDIRESSQAEYLAIIAGLAQAGAQAVILGCTESPCWWGRARPPCRSMTPPPSTPKPRWRWRCRESDAGGVRERPSRLPAGVPGFPSA